MCPPASLYAVTQAQITFKHTCPTHNTVKQNMAPNNSPTPSISPSQSGPSQPSIRNFFNRSGVVIRDSLSNVLDIPTSPNGIRQVFDRDSDSDDDSPMDVLENRKRGRNDDSILGDDVMSPPVSASMIANTSLQDGAGSTRRRRLSSDIFSLPQDAFTPTRIHDQMVAVRSSAALAADTVDTTVIQHIVGGADHSEDTNRINIGGMVDGVVELTRAAANLTSDHNSLAWDDTDINLPSNQLISPRPLPNISEEPDVSPLQASFPAAPPVVPNMVDMSALKQIVRDQLESACDKIESTILSSLREVNNKVAENTESIAIASARMDNIEEDNERTEERIDEFIGQVQSNSGHIDRIDMAIANISRSQSSNDQIQALINRIQVLEQAQNRNTLTEQEIVRLRADKQREDDDMFLRTVSFKGFSPPNTNNHKEAARTILMAIGCEDIIPSVSRVSFSQDRKRLKLTFPDKRELYSAVHYFADSIKQIRAAGSNPGLHFYVMTPPRFSTQREVLYKMAVEMKRNGTITRFSFFVKRNALCLKVSAPGQSDRVIDCPLEVSANDEQMEVETGNDELDPSCPICLAPYDDTQPISIYTCGHVFHTKCLLSSLSQTLKCPFCRTIPETANLSMINCDRCKEEITADQLLENPNINSNNLIMARKCHHFHLGSCQRRHLSSFEEDFPPTPAGLQAIIESEIAGCHSCSSSIQDTPRQSDIMHQVAYTSGMPNFVDLGDNTPNNVDIPTPTAPVINNVDIPTPTAPVIDISSSPLSGANATPIGPQARSLGARPRDPASLSVSFALPSPQNLSPPRSERPPVNRQRRRSYRSRH